MLRKVQLNLLSILFFVFAALTVTPALRAETDVQMLANYFDLLASGNYESAGYLWADPCLERANRFDIQYEDIPLKVDCASPIVRNLDVMKHYFTPPVRNATHLNPGNYSMMEFKAVVGAEEVKYDYYAMQQGDYHYLIYPEDYYCKDWPVIETRYFRIHYHPSLKGFLNPVVLDQADKYVDRIADSLKLSKDDLKVLSEKKIEYFYCNGDSTVKQLTGHMVKGTYDLASNDVISSFFPHFHEVTHLLVNLKLHKLPLYTLPIMREGIAVYYGGRWGKAPASLMALGGFLYNDTIVSLDSILTMTGFDHSSGADVAYPVAGLFAGYLRSDLGLSKFFDLYLHLSGKFDTLNAMSIDDVEGIIEAALGKKSWDDVTKDFGDYVRIAVADDSDLLPGQLSDAKESLKESNLVIYDDKDWASLIFTAPADQPPTGNVLFGMDPQLKGAQSSLYESHYTDSSTFEGYRYGIRFDQNEAGLYDYATNTLVAKYIWGITPSDAYYDKQDHKIFLKWKKSALNSAMPTSSDFKLLPN
ncbi:MAG TPA: hypothetical protein VJ983_07620 [candidate division Zixibacteria bacterium]|nr:hypothetical protein [candidate division Zixibacteria bacterium]